MKAPLNRPLILAALALLLPWIHLSARAADAAAAAATNALQRLQGTWEGFMVGQEASGKISVRIADQSLHFHRDTNFWFETTFTLPAGKDPQQLHATIQKCPPGQESSVGEVVVALFKIEGGTLTLVALGGGEEEVPKSFEAIEGKGADRYELRRVPPQGKDAEPCNAGRTECAESGKGTGRPADFWLPDFGVPGSPK
ncbi:MAG: hypothetical protein J0L84_09555 [Verrucomicrobia bacterium]|nr:hypothetical protein [Verrucomicrobiota bacterium]